MVQDDIPGVRGAQGGSGVPQGRQGVYATPGGKKSDKNSKKGHKPSFKVSKVYPDPKRVVHF